MQTIKLIEVSKSFKSKKALNKINIEFKSNIINGLLGPNGSGKTTLFNIIAGFLSPDIGKILLDDHTLNDKNLSLRTKLGISYLPQEASIFRDLSVYDNILSVAELFHKKEKLITKKAKRLGKKNRREKSLKAMTVEMNKIIDEVLKQVPSQVGLKLPKLQKIKM